MHRLDKVDYHILKLLQENSKTTNLDLSRMIGLSPAPTLERVKRLEQTGVIASYHATVSATAVGLNVTTFVLVSLAWEKNNANGIFLDEMNKVKEVTECYIITGEADYLIKIVCADIPAYEELVFKKLSKIEVIQRMKTMVTLSNIKLSKLLPLEYDL